MPIIGGRLKSGWSAIFCKHWTALDMTIGTVPPRVLELPIDCRIVICLLLENASVSYGTYWQGGKKIWEVKHDGRWRKNTHLEYSGDLPSEFDEIRKVEILKRAKHPDVDFMTAVPLLTAACVTGFDCTSPVEDDFDYAALKELRPRHARRRTDVPSWWQQLYR
jgi:hypothetical protein